MAVAEPMPDAATAGAAFVAAIEQLDFDRLEAVLLPSVRLRVLTPTGIQRASTAHRARRLIEGWFEGCVSVELLDMQVDGVADRLHIGYRLCVHDPDACYLVEQHGFADLDDGRLASLSIACSGFLPVGSPPRA